MSDIPLATHPFRVQRDQLVDLHSFPTRAVDQFPMSKAQGRKLMRSYAQTIDELQARLYAEGKHRLLVVLQAMDTAGKDGTIRSVFETMGPQGIHVTSFKRPNSHELAHDYLWRVHPHVPANGHVAIFNRSHYEDIIAVRVREIFPEDRWSKRYEHIVNFERMLTDEGTTIIKLFLHISRNEQKERLQARLDEPDKNWKFNPGDLDDRKLWQEYMQAYSDTISKTSTDNAPWYIIPADRKWYRNLLVADILIKTLQELDMQYPAPDFDPKSIRIN